MSKELKPCPFCGSKNIGEDYHEAYSVDSSYSTFGCMDCDASFIFDEGDKALVIKAWNTRTPNERQNK